MDELPKSMRGEECFFDDGEDNILGRVDEGEDYADAYDLTEANSHDIESRMAGAGGNLGPRGGETKLDADDYDFRMEGRGNPKAPRGLHTKSQNTGPKGVKKDYEDSKQAVRIQKTFDRMHAERSMEKRVTGGQSFYIDDIVHEMSQLESIPLTEEEKERQRIKDKMRHRQKSKTVDSDFDTDSNDEDSDDERQFAKFREERIKFIQASLPTYGSYMKVDKLDDLAELLKNNHESCYTVVHVYQNKNPICISVHLTFEAIVSQFPHVAFVRVRSDVAFDKEYDLKALPTLLLYKGSKLQKSILSLGSLLGMKPSDRDVVKLLADHGVLRMPTMGLDNITIQDKRIWKEDYEEGYSDDDDNSYHEKKKSIRASTLTTGFGMTGFDTDLLQPTRTANALLDYDDDDNDNDNDDDIFFDM